MRTRVLPVRLPENHWIWNEPNKREIIEEALDLYRNMTGELRLLKQTTDEIKTMLSNGVIMEKSRLTNEESNEMEQTIDPRLQAALEDFIDL